MFKVILLLKKKAGMSRDDFISYYENRHAVLARETFPQIKEYRRNYLDLDNADALQGAAAPDFDVITELWFDDRAGFDSMLATAADPAVAIRVAQDEENFIDREKKSMLVVQEHCS